MASLPTRISRFRGPSLRSEGSGRRQAHPLLIDHPRRLKGLKADWGKYGRRLADQFWPAAYAGLRVGQVLKASVLPITR